jgi:predicted Zn finger-like uncharacterized protein
MKITCQSCQAKYTIADDKVAGKTVKIKCKKCGSAIVVHGEATHAPGPDPAYAAHNDGDDAAETRVLGDAGGLPAAGGSGAGEWLVNASEGDERSMSTAQLAAEYARGALSNDTYVWKDGMSDWLPIASVPELMGAVAALAPATATPGPAGYGASQEPPVGLMGTVVMSSAAHAASAVAAAAAAPRPISSPPAAARPISNAPAAARPISNAPAAAAAAAPAAARRASARAGGVDVFGARERAESAAAAPSAPPPVDRMTGQRNENSVLFSLSALTAAETATKKQDEPALDLRPSPLAGRNGGRGNLDDIMSLGGGGMGAPILAPPPLLAPVVEAPPPPQPVVMAPALGISPIMIPEMPKQKSSAGIIAGVVVALLVVGGVAAAALGVFSPSPEPTASTDQASTTTEAQPAANTAAPADTGAAPADTAKPADTAASATKPADTGAVAAASPGTQGRSPGQGQPTTAKTTEKEAPKEPEKAAEPTPPPEKTAAPASEAGGDKPFNRGAATSALGAAAGSARGCKKPDGPTGSGKVRVTFAPSGNVTSAQVMGPPFAGTPVGGCVAGIFRGARVPPFSGDPISVTKSFSIN